MKLTEQQLAYFDTFGFLKFPGLLAEEVERISEAFGETWRSVGGGHDGRPHDHERRSALVPFIDRTEYLSALLDDPRIEGIAASLLGEDFNYSGSDGNYYVGDTKWHSDGYVGRKYLSVKMAFYLDPATNDTGCLRVIPGSHKYGDKFGDDLQEVLVRSTDNRNEDAWGIRGSDVPAAALETVPGDLLMFNHNIKHASFGGGTARRMFTINMEERYRDEDLGEARCEMLSPRVRGSGSRAPTARSWCARRDRPAWCTWSSAWPTTATWPSCRGRPARRWPSRAGARRAASCRSTLLCPVSSHLRGRRWKSFHKPCSMLPLSKAQSA